MKNDQKELQLYSFNFAIICANDFYRNIKNLQDVLTFFGTVFF